MQKNRKVLSGVGGMKRADRLAELENLLPRIGLRGYGRAIWAETIVQRVAQVLDIETCTARGM
ncbi:hypothetical protein IHE31_02380 (plasmid) [Mycetohabitans rhizoxinica]|uniref:Transposase n=1 Tax=Mycetohabitans rhizoxinica TaxID=412963 RepID=A0ABZ2PYJ4_9BURK|nr:hypothetical protein [Mycetohabitans sp. B2]MCF7697388.1 hypothetical protein [Mycetohabitans sp. B2]